jgi:hypothetical protein
MEVEVKLELHFEGETPCGRVLEPSGEAHEFTGWLGLTAAIDAAAESGSTPSSRLRRDDGIAADRNAGPLG